MYHISPHPSSGTTKQVTQTPDVSHLVEPHPDDLLCEQLVKTRSRYGYTNVERYREFLDLLWMHKGVGDRDKVEKLLRKNCDIPLANGKQYPPHPELTPAQILKLDNLLKDKEEELRQLSLKIAVESEKPGYNKWEHYGSGT